MINYNLTRSGRRTLGLYIRNGRVEVRAPLKLPKGEIDRFVEQKEAWILDKLSRSSEQAAKRDGFTVGYGSRLIIRGAEYPVAARDGGRAGFDGNCFYLPSGMAPEQIKEICLKTYRLLAKRYLVEKTLDFARRMSVKPATVKVNSARSRWGSCSTKKNINFSWRLIMAPDHVIDYVIVHELVHLAVMNHSARFWQIVEGIIPDYRERKKLLRELHRRLSAEDWD